MKHSLAVLTLLASLTSFSFADTCPPEGEQHKYLSVPIDFSRPHSGSFNYHYKLQNGFDNTKKTIVLLHGGPGGGMTSWDLCPGSYCLSELNDDYNIVTVDERGAGCSLLPEDKNEEFMTIVSTAEDLDFLRKHLVGVNGKISIMGVSFGTVMGVVYTSRHNTSVDKLILEGTVYSNEYQLNLAFEKNFKLMLNARPDIKKTFEELKIKLYNHELKITSDDFFGVRDILGYSYRGIWTVMPILITQLNAMDYSLWDAIWRSVEDSMGGIGETPAYQYIMCRELFDFSFPDFSLKPAMEEICQEFKSVNHLWRKYNSKDYTSNINVPTLLIVGKWDSATAPYNTYGVANNLSNARVFEVPYAGHGVLWEKRDCDTQMISSFLKQGFTKELDEIFKLDICQK